VDSGVLVGTLVSVNVRVMVGVLVGVRVTVDVDVGVLVGVKEETTNLVWVDTGVEEGRRFGVLFIAGAIVHVGGSTTGVGVWVGMSTVAGTWGGGKGLRLEYGLLKMANTAAPKKHAPTINKTERTSKTDIFMAFIHPRCIYRSGM
jgi:hypothetical protein